MVATTDQSRITEDETALYDRQIRLWGIETQRRLRNAHVMFIGINGLCAETAKNTALSGVKELTMVDDRQVNADDIRSNCLLSGNGCIGQKIVDAINPKLTGMNPLVKINNRNHIPASADELKGVDVVCVCNWRGSFSELCKLDELCSDYGVSFFFALTMGIMGILFCNLGNFEFMVQERKSEDGNAGKPATKQLAEKPVYTKAVLKYISLEKAVNIDLSIMAAKSVRRIPAPFLVFKAYQKYHDIHKSWPSQNDLNALLWVSQHHLPECINASNDIIKQGSVPENVATCAIVAGVLSQEITKVISKMDRPLCNFFMYDGRLCMGTVKEIGM